MGFIFKILTFAALAAGNALPRGNVMKLQKMTPLRAQFKQKGIDYNQDEISLNLLVQFTFFFDR